MAYFLSENDRRVLGEMFAWWRRFNTNTKVGGRSDQIDHEEFPAPEVYVAYSPSGGIPGRVGTVPGSEICDIYQISFTDGDPEQPELVQINPLTQRVYNISARSIGGRDPILVIRDKLGQWIVQSQSGDGSEPGTGTAPEDEPSGACNLAKLKTTDCIKVSTGLEDFYLRWDGTGWTSADVFNYGYSSGIFRAQWNSDTGLLDLFLNSLRLMNCVNGCYTGGPLTGHGSQTAGGDCEGDVFTVCLACHCCPDPLWDGDNWYCVSTAGTGTTDCEPLYVTEALACDVTICSGPYGSYAAAAAVCIPIGPADATCQSHLFTNATITITNKTGDCTCLNDTLTAGVQGTDSASWSSAGCANTGAISLTCSGGNYVLTVAGSNTITLTGTNSSPILLQYDITMTAMGTNFCTGTFTLTITDP